MTFQFILRTFQFIQLQSCFYTLQYKIRIIWSLLILHKLELYFTITVAMSSSIYLHKLLHSSE